MELHLPPKPTPTVLPGEFRFAAAGLAHGHIYGMVNGLLDAGAELVGVWDEDLKKVSAFQSAFPQAHAASCLDELLEQKCDALVVAQGLMASETVIYLHKKGLKLGEDIDLVTFVDYDSDINYLYSKQMDCIIQPVEKLGETAGELILRRIETPDAPAFEQVLTSTYQPCSM